MAALSIKIIVMRHGEAENNIRDMLSSSQEDFFHLTALGRSQVAESASKLHKEEKVDFIFSSPILRTHETAKIAAEKLSIPIQDIILDDRLREPFFGQMEGKTYAEYVDYLKGADVKKIPDSESEEEVLKRVGSFLEEIKSNPRFYGKAILIVTHSFTMCRIHEYLTRENMVLPRPAQYFQYSLKIKSL
jgi:uncharacterized phosphatase